MTESAAAISPAPVAPIPPGERIPAIDVLRGFALFGVLAANIKGYSWPATVYDTLTFHTGMGFLDQAVELFLLFFIRYKSVTLLSFLFGLGFSMQMSRAEDRGAKFAGTYARRNLVLLGFGILHIVFLWCWDILSYYAIAAFVLLAFRNKSPKSLRRWAIGFAVLAPLLAIVTSIDLSDTKVDPSAQAADAENAFNHSIDVHQHGTYGEILRFRLHEFASESLKVEVFLPSISLLMVLILMGRWTGRTRYLEDVPAYLPQIRKAFKWGLGLGVPASLLYVLVLLFFSNNDILEGLSGLLFTMVGSLLFIAYVAGIALLMQNEVWVKRLSLLAPTGRMTLTNYMMQSLICTTIFNGYGLGLYAKVGPAAGLLLTIVIYTFQILFSRWWFTKFQFGPMEWVWRALTYGKAPTFARTA